MAAEADAQRAPKRRKLDTPTNDSRRSTPASARNATPTRNGSTLRPTAISSPAPTSASLLAWQEAKAKAQAGRHAANKRAAQMGVQAQNGKPGRRKDDSAQSSPAPTSQSALGKLKEKKALDPLRNQKVNGVATSSPAKPSGSLGFFKQFSSQAITGGSPTPNKLANGTAHSSSSSSSSDAESGAEQDEEVNNLADGTPTRASTTARKKPSWHYEQVSGTDSGTSRPARRTFEDEIREIAEAAAKTAEQDEIESQHEAEGAMKRSSGRKPAPIKEPTRARDDHVDVNTRRPTPNKPVDRRKASRTDHIDAHQETEPEVEDRMDVHDSEDGVGPAVGTPSKSAPASRKASVFASKAKSVQPLPPSIDLNGIAFSAQQLRLLQKITLEKATSRRPIPLSNLEDQYTKVSTLISQTITAGESNSMLLIGARGSGKTALLTQILREQSVQRADDFHVVRLNGFIHTDDKIALKEIWRQLGRELGEEDTAGGIAETMIKLLALLSHSDRHNGEVSKSVIFILDEFDLFASHPRQTLLYNLFDIAQSKKAPIAVLGCTTRIDVVESFLEKRVKSRFSHRYVHLGLASTFAAFVESCRVALFVRQHELNEDDDILLEAEHATGSGSDGESPALKKWNTTVSALLAAPNFEQHIRRIYYTTKSVPDVLTSLLVPLATLPMPSDSPNTDSLTDAAFTTISAQEVLDHLTASSSLTTSSPSASKLQLLSLLSTLQLALLICAARLTALHGTESVSFNLAYEEYKVLASKAKLQASASGSLAAGARVWGKDVARDAWSEVLDCGLVVDDGRGGGRVDVGLEEIGMTGVELGGWGRWCREI